MNDKRCDAVGSTGMRRTQLQKAPKTKTKEAIHPSPGVRFPATIAVLPKNNSELREERDWLRLDASDDELRRRKVAAQAVALQVAASATNLLARQTDREVLDLRPSAAGVDDVLMDELALQIRANVPGKDPNVFSTVIMCGCENFTPIGMRSFVHAMGSRIRRLDFSSTALQLGVIKVLATGLEALDELDLSRCPSPPLTTEGIRVLLLSSGCASLKVLRVCYCSALIDDAIGAFVNLKKLRSLDVSYSTNLSDRGFQTLSKACQMLQFVNLEGLDRLSNNGLRLLVRSCRSSLRVLSLRRCRLLTDDALATIGDREYGARDLRSLNISGCDQLSATGILAMADGTPVLQALNAAGCIRMDERILVALASNCPLLQMLNIEGCVDITDTGLTTLATHLPFVELSKAYRGLAPRNDATERKLALHAQTIADSAALRIQACYRGMKGRQRAAVWRQRVVLSPAVRRIRRAYVCWRLNRAIRERAGRRKLAHQSSVKIQALVRGVMCRVRLEHEHREQKRLAVWAVYAVKVQAVYRSHFVRTRASSASVSRTMARYRLVKELLANEAAATLLQRAYRARFHRSRLDDIIAINQRRRKEMQAAATLVQRAYRTRGARRAYLQLLEAVHAQQAIVHEMVRYATKLQSRWRGHYARKCELTRAQSDARLREQARHVAASRINAGARGYFARRLAGHERVVRATRLRAVRVIERAWRVYKTPNAERIAYEVMLRRMKQNIEEEARSAGNQQRELLRVARALCEQDSASEAESDDDWRDFADECGDTFWFSPSRGERVYMRPNENARARCLLGMGCRVYWPLEDAWFNGRITKYSRGKDKHRIEYDDGDHEWLVLSSPRDRHRVQLFTGSCWCMAGMFEPSLRALRAVLFVGLRIQFYDQRCLGWRSGSTQGYSEASDSFLVAFDDGYVGYDEASGGSEWLSLFGMEDMLQIQEPLSSQWLSLSGFVFGATRGRPLDFAQRARTHGAAELASYYYSVSDFLDYVEPAAPVVPEVSEVEVTTEGGEVEVAAETNDSEQSSEGDDESEENSDEDNGGDDSDEGNDDEGDEDSDRASESEDDE